MLDKGVKPFPNELWNLGRTQPGSNLINVDKDVLSKTLLPRTSGKFTRKGLIVNTPRHLRRPRGFEKIKVKTKYMKYEKHDMGLVPVISAIKRKMVLSP